MAGLDPCRGASVHSPRLGKASSSPGPPVPTGLRLWGASKGPENQTSQPRPCLSAICRKWRPKEPGLPADLSLGPLSVSLSCFLSPGLGAGSWAELTCHLGWRGTHRGCYGDATELRMADTVNPSHTTGRPGQNLPESWGRSHGDGWKGRLLPQYFTRSLTTSQ